MIVFLFWWFGRKNDTTQSIITCGHYVVGCLLYLLFWWFIEPSTWEYGFECMSENTPNPYIKWLYIYAIQFYGSELVYLILKCKRTDRILMITHHGTTLVLLLLSAITREKWVGLLILFLHDVGDILLYLSEALHRYTKRNVYILKSVVFGMFAITFIYTRIYLFGYHVYWNGCVLHKDITIPHNMVMISMMTTLLGMHCYWLFCILRMLWRLVYIGNNAKDVRVS